MTDLWLGYAESAGRREVLMALRRIAPGSAVVFVQSPWELRERLREEEPRTVGAIVGHGDSGVSDLNLAAAVAHDGFASEVVLVARGASGSLRSRASRAGITRVVDATVAPGLQPSEPSSGYSSHLTTLTTRDPMHDARPCPMPSFAGVAVPAVSPSEARRVPLEAIEGASFRLPVALCAPPRG